MSDDLIQRLRDRLLALKRSETDRVKRIEIAECLADLDELERLAPPAALEQWRRVHGKNWTGTPKQQKIMQLFLAKGEVHRNHIAAILSGDDDNPASNETVRSAIRHLRKSLEAAKATAIVKPAGHDGVYRTHDPSFQTFR